MKNIDRDVNASINIRNYGLGQIDSRNHDTMKQEAQLSKLV